MPKFESEDWKDVEIVYGWEDDMTEEYRVVFEGPITKEMTEDENAIPALVVRGDRTYVYKSQSRHDNDRTFARDIYLSWCRRAGAVPEEFIEFLYDPEDDCYSFYDDDGPSMMYDQWLDDERSDMFDAIEKLTGKKIDRGLKLDMERTTYRCGC